MHTTSFRYNELHVLQQHTSITVVLVSHFQHHTYLKIFLHLLTLKVTNSHSVTCSNIPCEIAQTKEQILGN